MSSSSSGAGADASAGEPPTLRQKPQRRGNIGASKLYADEAAFKADVEAWEVERKVHKQRMAERKRARDLLRDRSGRQRDGETETDSERRVRQRQESPAAAVAHAQQQAAQRGSLRLHQMQQAWARDVGVFADAGVRQRRARLEFENFFEPTSDYIRILTNHRHLGRPHGDKDSKKWRELGAEEFCHCAWKVCHCHIGLQLDDHMRPLEPKRAALLSEC